MKNIEYSQLNQFLNDMDFNYQNQNFSQETLYYMAQLNELYRDFYYRVGRDFSLKQIIESYDYFFNAIHKELSDLRTVADNCNYELNKALLERKRYGEIAMEKCFHQLIIYMFKFPTKAELEIQNTET